MWVIMRKGETSTGVEYVKKYSNDKDTTWSLSEAQIYYTEQYAKDKADELGEGFVAFKIQ